MSTETKKKQPKMFLDNKGNEIPSTYIHKTDRDKDAAARRFHKEAVKISERLKEFKIEVLAKCDDLFNKTLAENRVTIRENAKGGFSITTIDKAIKIEVTISERIEFDDLIDIAKVKIKEYLAEITQGANAEIQILINSAFETSRGSLDTKKVMSLFRLKIEHPLWIEAMDIIKKSISTNTSKRYVRIWERDSNGEYNAIKLDFAAL